MLTRLSIRKFKSLADVTVELPRLAVFFGPNAAGKSNLLDAIQALSWTGNARTLFDALGGPFPVRGHPFEAFSFASGGLSDLLRQGPARFSLEADLSTVKRRYRYRVEPEIDFRSGQLSIADEYLAQLGVSGQPKGVAAIERVDSKLHIRRKGKPAHPRQEEIGLNHSVLSDRSLSGSGYPWLEQVRTELAHWRTYYYEPRVAMRAEEAPADVYDIGSHGEYIASFLYKLRAEYPKHFDAVSRALRSIVPGVEGLTVELDERRGTLNLLIRQSRVEYSSRVLSEGTLRVLALCAVTVNPWGGSLHAGMVLRRLSGRTEDTAPVLTLITQFGGGKTHTLTALYHLANAGAGGSAFPGVGDLLSDAGVVEAPAARTGVFVGNAWDPGEGRETPWIDLARQLAGDRGVAALGPAATTTPPGTEALARVFTAAGAPVLLLFDEALNFVNRHRGMAESFHAFLQNLTVAVTGATGAAAVISLPRSQIEMTDRDRQWQERITKVVRRVARDLIASDESEISEVVRRRLFDDLGKAEALSVVPGGEPITPQSGPSRDPEPKPGPEPQPLSGSKPEPASESRPDPGTGTTTLRLTGTVPPELWNRLGTRLLPKLRSGDSLSVGIELSVSVGSQLARSMEADLRQVLDDLGLSNRVEVERGRDWRRAIRSRASDRAAS